MRYLETYGKYSSNTSESYKKKHASKWIDDSGIIYYKSYETVIAFEKDGDLVVSENVWGPTTAKHINWVDNGDKDTRLSREDFVEQLDTTENRGTSHLNTVALASTLYGLIAGDDVEAANKYQKRFFETVPGIIFPDNWDELPEVEKAKRLESVINENIN